MADEDTGSVGDTVAERSETPRGETSVPRRLFLAVPPVSLVVGSCLGPQESTSETTGDGAGLVTTGYGAEPYGTDSYG